MKVMKMSIDMEVMEATPAMEGATMVTVDTLAMEEAIMVTVDTPAMEEATTDTVADHLNLVDKRIIQEQKATLTIT